MGLRALASGGVYLCGGITPKVGAHAHGTRLLARIPPDEPPRALRWPAAASTSAAASRPRCARALTTHVCSPEYLLMSRRGLNAASGQRPHLPLRRHHAQGVRTRSRHMSTSPHLTPPDEPQRLERCAGQRPRLPLRRHHAQGGQRAHTIHALGPPRLFLVANLRCGRTTPVEHVAGQIYGSHWPWQWPAAASPTVEQHVQDAGSSLSVPACHVCETFLRLLVRVGKRECKQC